MRHTPGPWKTEGYRGIIVNDSDGCTITLAPNGHKSIEEIQANARLIAAAPDLLEACRYGLEALGLEAAAADDDEYWNEGGQGHKAYMRLDHAIAKAEGKEPTP